MRGFFLQKNRARVTNTFSFYKLAAGTGLSRLDGGIPHSLRMNLIEAGEPFISQIDMTFDEVAPPYGG